MSLLEKTWLVVAKDSTWIMALLETTSSKMTLKAFREFDMPFFRNEGWDVGEIKEWMGQFATGPSRLKVALDSAAVLTDFIDFPRVSGKTLEKHFKDNISNYFDCDKDDYVINFKVAGFFEQGDLERIRILLAALPKDLLTRIYEIVGQLGIELASINIACECFMRLFEEMDPQRSQDMAVVDLGSTLGHVFLVEKGEVVSYAAVTVALSHLFRALKELEKFPGQKVFPLGGGMPLKKLISRSLGFETDEDQGEDEEAPDSDYPGAGGQQAGGIKGLRLAETFQRAEAFQRAEDLRLTDNMAEIFPEFAVVSPKITEPKLEALFIPYQNLPFSLDLTALDLQRLRKKEVLAMRVCDKAQGQERNEDELDSLFSDGGQRASFKRVADKIQELIQIYQNSQRSHPLERSGQSDEGWLEEEKSLFREVYVTGIGTAAPRVFSILGEMCQDVLSVSCDYPEGWQVPVTQRQEEGVEWIRYPCLLGLILKTHDEFN
ncbi:MAG: hypothetical protein FWG14_01120 [Peptococcaceae bacterium]|nr:hypothetical protein [Peptococcaceae bacterium]